MNNTILHNEVQEFIFNFKDDPTNLIFKKPLFDGVSNSELVQQIESRLKIRTKLPTWFQTSKIYYPPKINLEQTSSELAAKYKANLVEGDKGVDITGGFGVDSAYLSENFKSFEHCEINEKLSIIAEHNFEVLKKKNIKTFFGSGLEHIKAQKLDLIYADPSRRHESKGKVFFLSDCYPNVPKHLNSLFDISTTILLKTSPMLDIAVGLEELSNVKEIHIISIKNDVKELVWLMEYGYNEETTIYAVDIFKTDSKPFKFIYGEKFSALYGMPQQFLYEPNSAILKSGAFDLVSKRFNLKKLHTNSHLYSNSHQIDFPGKVFRINSVTPYINNQIKAQIKGAKANVVTRNFPETVESIKKKWQIKDGSNHFLFFTTLLDNKRVMISCDRL